MTRHSVPFSALPLHSGRDYRIVNLQKMRITLLLLIIYFGNCRKTATRFLKKTITNAFLCLQMIFPCF